MRDIILADIIINYNKTVKKTIRGVIKTVEIDNGELLIERVIITPPIEFYYKNWMKDKYNILTPSKVLKIIPIKTIGYTNEPKKEQKVI